MEPIAVLVVDDSVVIRRIVTKILSEDDGIRVVGTAASGRSALEKIEQLAPDILTLDIEMPEMDGLETLRHLRQLHPRLPVVMFSTLTERAAAATLEALSLGARDYVTKPGNVGSTSAALDTIRSQLLPKIKALVPRRPRRRHPQASHDSRRRAYGRLGPTRTRSWRSGHRPAVPTRWRPSSATCLPTCRRRSSSFSTCRRPSHGCSRSGWTD